MISKDKRQWVLNKDNPISVDMDFYVLQFRLRNCHLYGMAEKINGARELYRNNYGLTKHVPSGIECFVSRA
jgi:hypothetical protein